MTLTASPNEQREHSARAWLLGLEDLESLNGFSLTLRISRNKFPGVHEGDWALIADRAGLAQFVGRIFRIRESLEQVSFHFDRALNVGSPRPLSSAHLSLPSLTKANRLKWTVFLEALPVLFDVGLDGIPITENANYVRRLLQHAIVDDLLGPAQGPHETIIDMGVRERYLVGKLAPRDLNDGGIEGLQGSLVLDGVDEEPEDLEIHTGRHDPGAEFDSTTGKVDAEADSAEEIDASSNQSLVPSSFGMTFCVDGDVEKLEIETLWGRYERLTDHEHFRTQKNKETGEEEQVRSRVWQRIPCGGKLILDVEEGTVAHQAPDPLNPAVRIQGTIRPKGANGDRLVTLFLVNTQDEPDTNKDSAWVFQPELIVRATPGIEDRAIFRRRPLLSGDSSDDERASLEMIYRKQVEFAVGHGISVHARPNPDNPEHALEVRTEVLPTYEVPVTETPGLNEEDRPAMRKMVDEGFLDMTALADMDRPDLIDALSTLTADYADWITEQRNRIGEYVKGFDDQASEAMQRCEEIFRRLEEGIAVLADNQDDTALEAFRFANRAMALQRIHSIYALNRRRGEKPTLSELNVPKNRSWRPFQLAFVLLSIPSLADPTHKDRTQPLDADADLLWFPTGGGKTEAYLGVAAFTMAIRRLQGNVGIYDSSRGLAVIMRYTLRLLTLQQFQRATTLICAMEELRRAAIESGDTTLGESPFTIGLWVGNKVTPGRTQDSHKAIQDIRNPDKWDAGSSSPAQLTSCPWCGCEIAPGRDIEVDRDRLRTTIYCGDKKGRCSFSKGRSSKRVHPGLPAVVVDEELYHRPPSMMIATVDKFALMAWRGEARTLFGKANFECERHGLLWPEADCTGNHSKKGPLPRTEVSRIRPIRPPDLIIQDEFHLISGPLGTMVGLYETAVDELSTWQFDDYEIKPKIVASTATVRKAREQVNNVFMRRVCVFPPHGLDVEDNFFSVQRLIDEKPGRRYLGICSPGSSRPAMLIRVYTALLTAAQDLFDHFGQVADPYMTAVGYFNSLRELGGMRRLAEDDVQTRAYRVQMSAVARPGLAQRSVNNITELTSRVSSRDIPRYLDQLEVGFKAKFDPAEGKFVSDWQPGEDRAVDVVLATNMLSVGVDVNRLGLMAVNGQPKGTAEYIQATSRVGRQFPGLVCTVLTWARPRDLSHYETFEHYHATFYKHVEAQSVTPFSPRAMDRGLTGTLLSVMRLENDEFNPNLGAGELDRVDRDDVLEAIDVLAQRAWRVTDTATKDLAVDELKDRVDQWADEADVGGRLLGYEKRGPNKDQMVALLKRPGVQAWDDFTVPMSMREVEPGVRLIMSTSRMTQSQPKWSTKPPEDDEGGENPRERRPRPPKQADIPKLEGLAALLNQSLSGASAEVAKADGGHVTVSFLSATKEAPKRNSMVVAVNPDLKQSDLDEPGIAYGRFSTTELLKAGSNQVLIKLTIRRPGQTASITLPKSEWRDAVELGMISGD